MVSVTVEAGADDDDLGSVRLEDDTWALAIWTTNPDLWKLAGIEETDWDERRTLKVGTCANAPTWWSERDGTVYIHVGDDAEAYDFLVGVPLSAVHEILAQLELQELPRFRAPGLLGVGEGLAHACRDLLVSLTGCVQVDQRCSRA
jgi:hypothetical protein